jgi:cation:H+ antiporter
MVWSSILVFIIALIVILKSSDIFVESSARIAKLFGISEFVIGLTLVAVGTSFPELVTSIVAAIADNTQMVIGNIIGSNIANIGLVLAVASILVTMDIKKKHFKRDSKVLVGVSILFLIFSLDNVITWTEGVVFLIMFSLYIYFHIKERPIDKGKKFERYLGFLIHPRRIASLKTYEKAIEKGLNYRTYKHLLRTGIDLKEMYRRKLMGEISRKCVLAGIAAVAIFFGARYLIASAIEIAHHFNIAEEIIAITAIAIGTSLPELSVTITSARRGLSNILIGNLIGSCIANLLLISGIAALIRPLVISSFDKFFAIPYMLFMTFLFVRFIQSRWFTRVNEGVLLLFFYAAFIVFLIVFTPML